jgi:hypothetical protein
MYIVQIKEGMDESEPLCQQEKQITTDPPEQRNKSLVKNALKQNSKAYRTDKQNLNHNSNLQNSSSLSQHAKKKCFYLPWKIALRSYYLNFGANLA